MADTETNKTTVSAFWQALYERDWDRVARFFGDDSQYTDMPTPPDEVAWGAEQIVTRLRLGLDPLERIEHDSTRAVAAEGHVVMTEHAEKWHWPSGESVVLPFVSVMELRDDRILRWWDYWDLQTLMNAAPAWWIEHIMEGYT